MSGGAERFLTQNDFFAADLTEADREIVDRFAEHHAGGAYVVIRHLGGTRYVKAHDSWGDPADGKVVVHVYDADAADDPAESVTYFDGGHEALTMFMAVESDTIELGPSQWLAGVAAGIEVTTAHADTEFPDHQARVKFFWFYVGALAGQRAAKEDWQDLSQFMLGAALRQPQEPDLDEEAST